MIRRTPTLALLLAAGACTAPRPAGVPVVAAGGATPHVVPPPVPTDWRDSPLAPGSWSYSADSGGSSALYGVVGQSVAAIRCVLAAREVRIERTGPAAATLSVHTSYGSRTLPAAGGTPAATIVALPARDPLLDQIAFSRGRFTLELPGAPALVLPAWAEPARVIEDCRG